MKVTTLKTKATIEPLIHPGGGGGTSILDKMGSRPSGDLPKIQTIYIIHVHSMQIRLRIQGGGGHLILKYLL